MLGKAPAAKAIPRKKGGAFEAEGWHGCKRLAHFHMAPPPPRHFLACVTKGVFLTRREGEIKQRGQRHSGGGLHRGGGTRAAADCASRSSIPPQRRAKPDLEPALEAKPSRPEKLTPLGSAIARAGCRPPVYLPPPFLPPFL